VSEIGALQHQIARQNEMIKILSRELSGWMFSSCMLLAIAVVVPFAIHEGWTNTWQFQLVGLALIAVPAVVLSGFAKASFSLRHGFKIDG